MVGGAGAGECEEHGGQGREYWCTEDRQLVGHPSPSLPQVCCDCLILGSHRGHRALPAHQAPQEGRDEWRVQGKEEREEIERTEDRWLQGPKNWRAEEESNVMPVEDKAISLEEDDDDESEDELVAMKDLQLASTAPAPSLPQPALWEVLLSLCEVRLLPAAAARALAVLAAPPEVPEERLAGLLTTRPGSLLSAARRRLTSHLASPGDQTEQQLLAATLGLVAACLAAPSAATSLAIFHVGRALSARCLDTGNSFMHDLTIVCASDEPAMASVAVRALARLASKASAPALVAASLPHLAPLLSSATPGVLLAAVTVVHEVAVTEEAAVLVTKAGLGVSLLLPALAALLAEQRRGALLPPRPMALVLGSVRALLAPLPPGSLPEPLLAELAAAVAWTEGEGSHERLVASVGAAPVLLPEYRHLQHFPTPDTRARLRILEQEFRQRWAAVGGAGTEVEGGQEELGVEEVGVKRSVLDGRGKNLVDTKKDEVKSSGLPGWLGGEDESSDEEDFENESRGDDYGEVKEVEEALAGLEQGGKVGEARGRPREESDSGVSSDEAQPSPGAGGQVGGMKEVVVKGELISVCQVRRLW